MSNRFSNGDGEMSAQKIMEDIRDGKYTSSVAFGLLKQIVSDLPGTSVASEAQAYLDIHF